MDLRVVGVGLGRTGTNSLKLALERLLGAPCHHMLEVFANEAQFPLWVAGRRVRTLTPMIPLGGHLRLIVGVVSYDGALDVGVTGDGVHGGDVDVLARGIERGLDELLQLSAALREEVVE